MSSHSTPAEEESEDSEEEKKVKKKRRVGSRQMDIALRG